MEFIKEADIRSKEKENKKNKIDNIKKEAVKAAKQAEKEEEKIIVPVTFRSPRLSKRGTSVHL